MSHDNQGVLDASVRENPPVLTFLTSSCSSGTCPTVFTTDRGTLVVQGYTIQPDKVGLDVPEGEQLVEIPIDLIVATMQKGA